MRVILATSGNPMNNLERAGIGTKRSVLGLPSWVPNWSLTTPFLMKASPYTSRTQYTTQIDLNLNTNLRIALHGCLFDRIKKVGSIHEVHNNLGIARDYACTARWLVEVEALAIAQIPGTYNNKESRLEAFITMVGNRLMNQSRKRSPKEQCFNDYAAVKRGFTAISETQEPLLGWGIPNYLFYRKVSWKNLILLPSWKKSTDSCITLDSQQNTGYFVSRSMVAWLSCHRCVYHVTIFASSKVLASLSYCGKTRNLPSCWLLCQQCHERRDWYSAIVAFCTWVNKAASIEGKGSIS